MSDYDLFARLYELEHRDLIEDIELYRNFALRCDGPVLELGCGTGRVGLALARAGLDVVGVDSSAVMVSLARARAAEAGLSEQFHVHHLDVRALGFEDQFALAIYPLNGFLHLTEVEGQRAALGNVYRALLDGGLLILDLPNPHIVFSPAADRQLVLRRRFTSPEGRPITSLTSTETDLAAQVQRLTLLYDEEGQDGLLRRTTVQMALRFVYRYEMAGLLRESGFKVDAVYGSYDLDPYDADGDIMLFVAYK